MMTSKHIFLDGNKILIQRNASIIDFNSLFPRFILEVLFFVLFLNIVFEYIFC